MCHLLAQFLGPNFMPQQPISQHDPFHSTWTRTSFEVHGTFCNMVVVAEHGHRLKTVLSISVLMKWVFIWNTLYLAKIEQDALQLDEAGTYSTVVFKNNDWIVSVCQYASAPTKTNGRGDRFYKKGYSRWIPCNAIIRCLTKPIKLRWVGQYYKLEKALNDYVEEHRDISY